MNLESKSAFSSLNLDANILRAIAQQGYETTTEVQGLTIPHALDKKDILALAQTGSGKTAAFLLPTLQKITENPIKRQAHRCRVLILAPTRELAHQIQNNAQLYGKYLSMRSTVVYGGVRYDSQIRSLKKGLDILIATPGRLLDLHEKKHINFESVDTFILDEVDRMLDMGFMPDIEKILKTIPSQRQTMLFSATMPKSIRKIAQKFLNEAIEINVSSSNETAKNIHQSALFVKSNQKTSLLRSLLGNEDISKSIVFTRTKHTADKLSYDLNKLGFKTESIHGDKSQRARNVALDKFKRGKCNILIATDVASRGIDVNDISHVINYDFPEEAEAYVHRIGRTGRAGRHGHAISFISNHEKLLFSRVQKGLDADIEPDCEQPFHCQETHKRCLKPSNGGSKNHEGKFHHKKYSSKKRPSFAKKRPSSDKRHKTRRVNATETSH